MENFPTVCRAFAVEAYISRNYLYITMVREYRNRFNLVSSDHVPSRKTLLMWVKNFRKTAVASKKTAQLYADGSYTQKCGTSVTSSRSGTHSYHVLEMSNLLVRRILHCDLHYHPYKILLTQELKQTDYKQRRMFARWMFTSIEEGEIMLQYLLMNDEAHFHVERGWTNRTVDTGHPTILMKNTSEACTRPTLQFGLEWHSSVLLGLIFSQEMWIPTTISIWLKRFSYQNYITNEY